MKVLVTGGCGFIGTNLIYNLDLSEVKVLDFHDSCQRNKLPERVQKVPGSMMVKHVCDVVCRDVEAVIHLAARTGVAQSLEDPVRDCEENIVGTVNLLDAARKNGVKRFIFASSGCVVGNQAPPFHEVMIRMPSSPYAASKASCEMYCQAFSDAFDLETVVLRFSNVYGPHSIHKRFNLIPGLIMDAFEGKPTKIYGDGRQTRDYIYVQDIVQGIKLALTAPNLKHEIFQLGTGIPTDIHSIIRELNSILEEYGKRCMPSFVEERQGELKNNFVNYRKANETLKFNPRYDLKRGLRETVKWYAENKK